MKARITQYLLFFFLFFLFVPFSQAQIPTAVQTKESPHVEVSFSPRSGSFIEGSTFDVPIIINSREEKINGIEIRISYDKNKLSIIQPSTGISIIGVWVEPPTYNNAKGSASYVGVIPNGLITNSGIIGTVTFKALATGPAVVSIRPESNILLHDGLGTKAIIDRGRAEYTILPKAPEGVNVFSETHPSEGSWYNNNNPVVSWEKDTGVTGFSFEIDNKPFTVPDNIVDTSDTTQAFENLKDGLWYFHIKANKKSAWGTTGHFLMRVDTTPPADFTPETDYLISAAVFIERTLVSFFTTDNLSGIDHYEVGVIDKSQPVTASPVFVETESPYQVPMSKMGSLSTVIVRAVDKAGNVRDASIDIKPPFLIEKYVREYIVYILGGIILIGLFALIIHYLVGHHIIRHLRRVFTLANKEDEHKHDSNNDQVVPPPQNPLS